MCLDVPVNSKSFYNKFLVEGLPHPPKHLLPDYFLAEIAVKTIENKDLQSDWQVGQSYRQHGGARCLGTIDMPRKRLIRV